MTVILTILGIGLLILVVIAAVVIGLLKKGSRFLFKSGHGHRHYSSSDNRHSGHHKHQGHQSYGHSHYRKKHSSRSGFFSS